MSNGASIIGGVIVGEKTGILDWRGETPVEFAELLFTSTNQSIEMLTN